ncbi:TPA: LysR family transcriptional regulator [Klebsiella quasipneumoniae]|nr:LysR family transcriptional regulator [Klebsiella quasipneumoniae]
MLEYPDINIKNTDDNGQTVVVDDRLNAGLRLGEQLAIACDQRMRQQANWPHAVPGQPRYYPSRRQHTSAFILLRETLRR